MEKMTIERTIEILEEWQDLLTYVASEEFSTAYAEAVENNKKTQKAKGLPGGNRKMNVEEFDEYVDGLERLYIYTTSDQKRLPLYVAENIRELSEMTGKSVGTIKTIVSKRKNGKIKTSRFECVEY